jgi:hypothetical protein
MLRWTDRPFSRWKWHHYHRLKGVESSWNMMAHGDAREGKWRWNWRIEWVASTLHTTSEHGVSSITTADAHTSAASSRLNWRSCRFKWTRPFRRKTKSGFCACAITFQTQSTVEWRHYHRLKGVPADRTEILWKVQHRVNATAAQKWGSTRVLWLS